MKSFLEGKIDIVVADETGSGARREVADHEGGDHSEGSSWGADPSLHLR